MKRTLLFLLMTVLVSSCGSKPTENPETVGDTREHYDWLFKQCQIVEKLIEESGFTQSATALGRRPYCTEMEEMLGQITGILDRTAPGALDN